MKVPWFLRNTGSPVQLAFSDCECKSYGRPHCYGCVVDKNYEENPPRLTNITTKPSWFKKYQQAHLNPADVRFLNGISEVKPFYKRRQRWQRSY